MKLKNIHILPEQSSFPNCSEQAGCPCNIGIDREAGLTNKISSSELNIPFELVDIEKGATVVNIISDIGYEISKESEKTGTHGKVIGIDVSPAMMFRAKYKLTKTGHKNVFFKEILSPAALPMEANTADTLIYNNVLNQFPGKNLFSEMHRILKPYGIFYIYDILSFSGDPTHLDSGIITKRDYILKLTNYGFRNILFKKPSKIVSIDKLMRKINQSVNPEHLTACLITGEKNDISPN
jgi:ubiquinone/menaquinone biosynthesis C-methylase UbiE